MKTAVLSLVLLGLVLAGPIDVQQRRANSASSRSVSESQEKRACADGAFQCAGKELQRCSYSSWVTIAQCSGDNIVCSADSSAVGCVWSWSAGNTPAQSSSTPSSTKTAGPSATHSPSSVVQSVVSSSSSAPRSSVVAGNLNAGVKTSTRASTTNINSTRSSAPVISTSTQASAPSVSATSNVSSHSASARATSGGGPSGQFSAPHYVIYADNWLSKMPSASDISSYNRFILAFWMTNSGAVDNAQAWAGFDASYRQQVLNEYHNAGIALMVSAFGSTDYPTSNGADPTQTAQKLAAWVKQYGLDGVDIDYEDMDAMNGNRAESWLITFQQELRRQLPSPYIISHAPVAPWFTSGSNYPSGAYVDVHKKVGSGIDFYNVQFYNQGNGVYGDCSSLIHNSGSAWPDTSVSGINSHAGVPLNKIVIGKPLNQGDASNGYVDPSTLNTCVGQARSMGWNAGVMFWQWASGANSVMATVRG